MTTLTLQVLHVVAAMCQVTTPHSDARAVTVEQAKCQAFLAACVADANGPGGELTEAQALAGCLVKRSLAL